MPALDDVLRTVIRQLAVALDVPAADIAPDAPLTHLDNASSLRLLAAVAAIEDELAIEIDADDLVRVRSVTDFARLVGTHLDCSEGE